MKARKRAEKPVKREPWNIGAADTLMAVFGFKRVCMFCKQELTGDSHLCSERQGKR